MKRFLILLPFLFPAVFSSQNIEWDKSVLHEQGAAETMVVPNLKLQNKGASTAEIKVRRHAVNLPPNWYTCFCYLECNPPSVNELQFFMSPGETVDIGIGFGTDAVPGTGSVTLIVEVIGGTQKDTITFTGSTVVQGLPQPASKHNLILYPALAQTSVRIQLGGLEPGTFRISDSFGRTVMFFDAGAQTIELDVSGWAAGRYYVEGFSDRKRYSGTFLKH